MAFVCQSANELRNFSRSISSELYYRGQTIYERMKRILNSYLTFAVANTAILIYGAFDAMFPVQLIEEWSYTIWGSLLILLFLPLQTKIRKLAHYSTWPFTVVVSIFSLLTIRLLYLNRFRLEIPNENILSYCYRLYPEVLGNCLMNSLLLTALVAPPLFTSKGSLLLTSRINFT